MTTDQLLEKVLSNTHLKADCYMRLLLARDFTEQMRYAGAPADGAVKRLQEMYMGRPEGVAAAAVAAWGEDVLAALGTGDIAQTFGELTGRIAALPELVLYAPTRLSPDSLERIGAWFRANVNEQALIDVRINPEVVGGCAFVWKDQYHDFSLSHWMEKYQKEFGALMQKLQPK